MAETGKIIAERSMTLEEINKWNKIRQSMNRTRDLYTMAMSERNQIIIISKFCTDNGYFIDSLKNISEIEENLLNTGIEVDNLTNIVHDAELGIIGVVYRNGDFDVVTSTSNKSVSGFGFPPLLVAAIGIVSVVALFARWAYVEHKLEDTTEKLNKIIKDADSELCANPNSDMCKKWKDRKIQKDYKKEETISETIQKSIGIAGKGIGIGIAIAIPIFAYFLGRKQ